MEKSKIVIEIMKWVSIKQNTNAAGSTQVEITDGKILRRRERWITYLLLITRNTNEYNTWTTTSIEEIIYGSAILER